MVGVHLEVGATIRTNGLTGCARGDTHAVRAHLAGVAGHAAASAIAGIALCIDAGATTVLLRRRAERSANHSLANLSGVAHDAAGTAVQNVRSHVGATVSAHVLPWRTSDQAATALTIVTRITHATAGAAIGSITENIRARTIARSTVTAAAL